MLALMPVIGLGPLKHARYRLEPRRAAPPLPCPACGEITLAERDARLVMDTVPQPLLERLFHCESCHSTFSRPPFPLRVAGIVLLLPLVLFTGVLWGGALLFAGTVLLGWLHGTTPDAQTLAVLGLSVAATSVGVLIPTRRLVAGFRKLVRVELPVD